MAERTLRPADPGDAEAIAAIYAPYVTDSLASFETLPPDGAEMRLRMQRTQKQFPWLVYCLDGRVAGYAYASRLGERKAYDWSAVASIYVEGSQRRGGVGRVLYTALEQLLALQGYRALFAAVALPNPDSERFHQRMGYQKQGEWTHAGYKFGRVAGVAHYAKDLLPVADDPPPPCAFSQLAPAQVNAVLAQALGPQMPGQ